MAELSMVRGSAGERRLPPACALAQDLPMLLHRIGCGEQAALAELYDSTVAKLFSLASLIVRNAEDAEEVVCDVFCQVWQSARQYDPARGSVLAWLLTICRSRALDMRRNRSASRRIAPTAEEDTEGSYLQGPDDLLQVLEQGTAVYRVLESLPPVRRRLIGLAFFQGLTHEEIARETGLPLGTVKSHLRRGLATMRLGLRSGAADAQS